MDPPGSRHVKAVNRLDNSVPIIFVLHWIPTTSAHHHHHIYSRHFTLRRSLSLCLCLLGLQKAKPFDESIIRLLVFPIKKDDFQQFAFWEGWKSENLSNLSPSKYVQKNPKISVQEHKSLPAERKRISKCFSWKRKLLVLLDKKKIEISGRY